MGKMVCAWIDDPRMRSVLVDFFIRHAGPEYISHSELQGGRASDIGQWAYDLRSILEAEVSALLASARCNSNTISRLAAAFEGARLIGLAIVRIEVIAPERFADLEDFIIHEGYRRSGLGAQFLAWVEKQLQQDGVRRLYLESGITNEGAHRFFASEGYGTVAKVMMKPIQPKRSRRRPATARPTSGMPKP